MSDRDIAQAERPARWVGVALLYFGVKIGWGSLAELGQVVAKGRWLAAFPPIALVVIAGAALVVGSRIVGLRDVIRDAMGRRGGGKAWRTHESS